MGKINDQFRSIDEVTNIDQSNSEIIIAKNTIDLNDEQAVLKNFGSNKLSLNEDDLNLDTMAWLCKTALSRIDKVYNEYFLSWCLLKLLEKVSPAFDSKKPHNEQKQLLDNDYFVLTTWFLHKTLHLRPGQASDTTFKWDLFFGKDKRFDFQNFKNTLITSEVYKADELPNLMLVNYLYSYILPFASRVDTQCLATGCNFYTAYNDLFIRPPQSHSKKKPAPLAYPSKFGKIWQAYQDEPGEALMVLLEWYVQFTSANDSELTLKRRRFFAGKWNQTHNDTVKHLLISNYIDDEPFYDKAFSCEFLLEGLRSRLILAREPLNPEGTLAKIITYTQMRTGIESIDIDTLNTAIKRNKDLKLFPPLQIDTNIESAAKLAARYR